MYHLEVQWAPTYDTLQDLLATDKSAATRVAEFRNSDRTKEQMLHDADILRKQTRNGDHRIAAIVDEDSEGRFTAIWFNSWEPFTGELVKRRPEKEIKGEGAGPSGDASGDSDSDATDDGAGDLWKVSDFVKGRWMDSQYVAEYQWRPNWMTRPEIIADDPEAGVRICEFEVRLLEGTLGSEQSEMSLGESERQQTRKM
jgi:hypothetical protein